MNTRKRQREERREEHAEMSDPKVVGGKRGIYKLVNVPKEVKPLLRSATENDPVVVFDWNSDILHNCVNWANINHPALPPWFNAVYPLTVQDFKMQILSYCASATNGAIHGHTLIAPNTLREFGRIRDVCRDLCCRDDFIFEVCANGRAPLATLFFIADGRRPVTVERADLVPVPAGAVQAFQ